MGQSITINSHIISTGQPTYIVAEMSANHNKDFDKAVKIIEEAKKAGADAIKLQTYTPDTLTLNCESKYFQLSKDTIWKNQYLYDLYAEAYMPWDWQPKLQKTAGELGIDFFSTPFDDAAVAFLESIECPAYKIASSEIVDIPLIETIARTGRPVIMSVGMATLSEIDEAVSTIRRMGNDQIALLKCTCTYPALPEEMNLRTIPSLSAEFDVPVGLSDHTLGIVAPVAAVALGACMVEKHLKLAGDNSGPDSAFSLEPSQFKEMVDAIRIVERALGKVTYEPTQREETSRLYRRSLFVVKDVKRGELLTEENVKSIRPGYGLPPRFLPEVLGHRVIKDVGRGTPLSRELLD